MKPKDNPQHLNELYPDVVFALETISLLDSLTRRLGVTAEIHEGESSVSIAVQFEQNYMVELTPLSVPEGQSSTWFMERLRAGRMLTKTEMLAVICTVKQNGIQEPAVKPFALEAEHPAIMLAKISTWIFKVLKIRIQPLQESDEEETENG
jgi:hypothetical protein